MKDPEQLLMDLKRVLYRHKVKPYLPIWGEVFCLVLDIKNLSINKQKDILFYNVNPSGTLLYSFEKKVFIVKSWGINIHLKDNEIVDALLDNRFVPQ